MWLVFITSLAIFSHFGSGAAITKEKDSFWIEDSCQNSSDKNITKSFNEAKKFCNLEVEKVVDSESPELKLCEKLKVNFKDLCVSGKKGSAQPVPPVCVLVHSKK